jgi:uncharacterized RDD family membrane protein YckC
MRIKDLLIVLVIIQLGFFLYNTPNIFRSFVNFFDSGFLDPLYFLQYLNQFLNIILNIVGIIGVVLYFSQNGNVYNKALKIFLIDHTLSLIAYFPTRLIWIFNPPNEGFVLPWHFHIMFAIALFLAIIAIMVYSQQKIRVLPVPIKSKSVRFAHYIIDNIFLNALIFGNIYFFIGNHSWVGSSSLYLFFGYAFAFAMPFIYYTVCETGFKQTIGKVLTGAYVCNDKGGAPGLAKILGRSLCRYIPFEPFSFLPDPMAKWHDKFSGTDVFYKSNVVFDEDPIIDHLVGED